MNMQDFKIVKKGRVYFLTDPECPEDVYTVQKPNGKIICNCPDFRNAPHGTCDHIEALREYALAQSPEPAADAGGRLLVGSWPQDPGSGSEPPAASPNHLGRAFPGQVREVTLAFNVEVNRCSAQLGNFIRAKTR